MLYLITLLFTSQAHAQYGYATGNMYTQPTYQAPTYQAPAPAPVYNAITSDQGTTTIYQNGERAMRCYTTSMGTTRCQ